MTLEDVLKGDATPYTWLDALGTPYKANKVIAGTRLARLCTPHLLSLQIIGTGSRTVNNVLSLVSKKYPRAVLVHKDRLLCCKCDEMELCTYKWLKKLLTITRLRRIPKPNYALTNSAEVAVEFDEVDPETGVLFEEIFSFAREVDAERFMRDVEEGRRAARKARMDASAAREAAEAAVASPSHAAPSLPPKTPSKPAPAPAPAPPAVASVVPTFDAFGSFASAASPTPPLAHAHAHAVPIAKPPPSATVAPDFDAFGEFASSSPPAQAAFTSLAAAPRTAVAAPLPAAVAPAPPASAAADFGDPFGEFASAPAPPPPATPLPDLLSMSFAPPPLHTPPNLLDDAAAPSAAGPLQSLPTLAAALPGVAWTSPVKLSRDGPKLGEESGRAKKADPFASLMDM